MKYEADNFQQILHTKIYSPFDRENLIEGKKKKIKNEYHYPYANLEQDVME